MMRITFFLMRYNNISFIFVISMIDLVGIESNITSIDQFDWQLWTPKTP